MQEFDDEETLLFFVGKRGKYDDLTESPLARKKRLEQSLPLVRSENTELPFPPLQDAQMAFID